jgi:hypothetical protein
MGTAGVCLAVGGIQRGRTVGTVSGMSRWQWGCDPASSRQSSRTDLPKCQCSQIRGRTWPPSRNPAPRRSTTPALQHSGIPALQHSSTPALQLWSGRPCGMASRTAGFVGSLREESDAWKGRAKGDESFDVSGQGLVILRRLTGQGCVARLTPSSDGVSHSLAAPATPRHATPGEAGPGQARPSA